MPVLTAPVIEVPPRGCSLIVTRISVAQFLQERKEEDDLFDGPLTDYEWSVEEEGQGSSSPSLSKGKPVVTSIRRSYLKESQRRRRNLKRSGVQKDEGAGLGSSGVALKTHVLKHRVRAARGANIVADFSMASDANVTVPGWVGKMLKGLPRSPLGLDKLRTGYGLTLFAWDGRCVAWLSFSYSSTSPSFSTSHLILDREKTIVGVLVGQPQDDSWRDACKGAYKALHQVASKVKPNTAGTCGHRRGISVGIPHGISLGPGHKVRCWPCAAARELTQLKGATHAPPENRREGAAGGGFGLQPLRPEGVQVCKQCASFLLLCPICLSRCFLQAPTQPTASATSST